MLQHISISIFQVLQCTSFLSKLLTLVELRNNNNDEVYIFKLIFNTGINRALCFTRKQLSVPLSSLSCKRRIVDVLKVMTIMMIMK